MPSGGRERRSPVRSAERGGTLRWWRALDGSWRVVIVGSIALLVAAGVTVGLLGRTGGGGAAPQVRQYLTFTACLLTGPGGVADGPAATAWAGMEQASLRTRAQVQYLPVMPGTTAGAAAPVLASLIVRHCGLVIAAGAAQVAAVEQDAPRYRSVRFAVLGKGAAGPNVAVVPAGMGMRASVVGLVSAAVSGGGR